MTLHLSQARGSGVLATVRGMGGGRIVSGAAVTKRHRLGAWTTEMHPLFRVPEAGIRTQGPCATPRHGEALPRPELPRRTLPVSPGPALLGCDCIAPALRPGPGAGPSM